jgi:hypothetical protein
MIVPDSDVVAVELAEARQRADGVVVIIQDGDLHDIRSLSLLATNWKIV